MEISIRANPFGGFDVVLRENEGRVTNLISLEDFRSLNKEVEEQVAGANRELAWLNDDNQMEDGNGNIYVRVPHRKPVRRKEEK